MANLRIHISAVERGWQYSCQYDSLTNLRVSAHYLNRHYYILEQINTNTPRVISLKNANRKNIELIDLFMLKRMHRLIRNQVREDSIPF